MPYSEHSIISSNPHLVSSKRKRSSHEENLQEDIAWTAARCQRLLRAISSRISTLRRLVKSDVAASSGTKREVRGSALRVAPARKSEHWSTKDPVWLPSGVAKAPVRTYAARTCARKTTKSSSEQNSKSRKSSIAFPTPFVKRTAAWPMPTSTDAQTSSKPPQKATTRMRRSKQLPIKPTSQSQEAEKGLRTALSHLLHTTQSSEAIQQSGARSLLGTCLRKVPHYIDVCEEDVGECQSSDDTSLEVYGYLEDFGTREDGGWEGLREVVRSHALHLICEAIEDEVLSDALIQDLVDTCSNGGAVHEGQDILQSWLVPATNLEPPHLHCLQIFSHQHQCEGAKFKILRACGEQDLDHFARLAENTTVWNGLLSCLASSRTHEGAAYLTSALESISDLESQGDLKARVITTTKDFMVKLTVMAITSLLSSQSPSESVMLCEAIPRSAVHAALGSLYDGADGDSPSSETSAVAPLLMLSAIIVLDLSESTLGALTGSMMAETLLPEGRPGERRAHRALEERNRLWATDLAEAICGVEKYVGFPVAELFIERIAEKQTAVTAFAKQVAVAVLTVLRQTRDDMDNAVMSNYLTQLVPVSKHESTLQTPFRRTQPKSIRWESGLCEWVTATPFPTTDAYDDGIRSAACEDKENEREAVVPSDVFSPDILAPTPAVKRAKTRAEAHSPIVLIKREKSKPRRAMKPATSVKRRTSSRLSAKESANEDDELAF